MKYSIIRFLPDPFTGEFRNIGAVAGADGDLKFRLRDDLVDKLPDPWITAVHRFAQSTGESLEKLHHDHRNCIQLSPPSVIVAESPEDALDFLFRTILRPLGSAHNILVPLGKEHL